MKDPLGIGNQLRALGNALQHTEVGDDGQITIVTDRSEERLIVDLYDRLLSLDKAIECLMYAITGKVE